MPEAKTLTRAPVRVLEGGTAGLDAGGLQAGARPHQPAGYRLHIDAYLHGRIRAATPGVEEAMRAYLMLWEIDLVHQIERDGTVRFGV